MSVLAASVAIFSPAQLLAQSYLEIGRSQTDPPAAVQLSDAETERLRIDATQPGTFQDVPSFLKWGHVTARPHLTTDFSYGNRLRTRSGGSANTVLEQISPGILLQLGPKWHLDYTPRLSYYSSRDFKDTLDHNVAFGGGTAYESWTFGLSQTYSSSTQPLIETGAQTGQEIFATAINASHYFNSKLMLELGVNQSFRDAEGLSSSKSWSTMDWLNYQISSRVSIAGGLGAGFDDVDRSPDMTHEDIQARVNAKIAEKLTLSLNAGGEIRQIHVTGADQLINPIYGASIQYHPFEHTTLTLAGNRTVGASLFQGQITESTDVSLALSQRLLGVLNLSVGGSFGNRRYIISGGSLALNREDNTTSFFTRLGYEFITHGTAAVFYNLTDNSSSTGSFNYSSHQVGLELAYRF